MGKLGTRSHKSLVESGSCGQRAVSVRSPELEQAPLPERTLWPRVAEAGSWDKTVSHRKVRAEETQAGYPRLVKHLLNM